MLRGDKEQMMECLLLHLLVQGTERAHLRDSGGALRSPTDTGWVDGHNNKDRRQQSKVCCQHRKKETNCQEDNRTRSMDRDGSNSAESHIQEDKKVRL